MTPILIALAAAAAAPQSVDARFKACTDLVRIDPAKGIAAADEWRLKGGGLEARQCLGLAYSAAGRFAAAATVFEQAAREAEAKKDRRSGDFWAQSGNGWLAAGDAEKARRAFDSALAGTATTGELRGEVHLDRARTLVSLNDVAGARADLDKALELVPADPFAWYLSAALARRQNDLARARKEIEKAVELAPADAPVLLEAGNIAGLSGDLETARTLYARAAKAAPESEAGRAAQAALAANSEPAPSAGAPRS